MEENDILDELISFIEETFTEVQVRHYDFGESEYYLIVQPHNREMLLNILNEEDAEEFVMPEYNRTIKFFLSDFCEKYGFDAREIYFMFG